MLAYLYYKISTILKYWSSDQFDAVFFSVKTTKTHIFKYQDFIQLSTRSQWAKISFDDTLYIKTWFQRMVIVLYSSVLWFTDFPLQPYDNAGLDSVERQTQIELNSDHATVLKWRGISRSNLFVRVEVTLFNWVWQ